MANVNQSKQGQNRDMFPSIYPEFSKKRLFSRIEQYII